MDVSDLLALRIQIDAILNQKRHDLEEQLAALNGRANGRAVNGRTKSLKGTKVAPKYRSKKDPVLTWAGRGATPHWLRNEMKAGKLKKEAFLIK
jgi:DNA-binding protein H-NS